MNYRVIHGEETRNPLVSFVDLNDESVELLGESLDTREAFGDMLDVLSQSNTFALFDFLFTNEKKNDELFINAIEYAGNTVIAVLAVEQEMMKAPYRELNETEKNLLARHVWNITVTNKGEVPEAASFLLPIDVITETTAQLAHINMEVDQDGKYRRVPLLYGWNGGYIPSLPLATAILYLGIPVESIELKAGEYLALPLSETEVIHIPIDEKGRMLVPYTEAWTEEAKRIPFADIVEAKTNDDMFETVFSDLNGHIVLVAEISTSQKDFGPTSFERLFPLSGIHAAVLSGILDGIEPRSFIGWASLAFKVVILLLILCAAFSIMQARNDALFHCGFFAAFVIFSGVTFFRWQNLAISPWFTFPAILLLFLWIGAFLNRLFVRYSEQLLLRNALSRYFPRSLGERIIREKKTELIPSYKELTILFSDISGFTKWSSDKSPENVHAFLDDYLESMAEILFAHGGTVDKFMGDGILAFFGDPFDMPNHCERCIQAAIAMQNKVRVLAEKWKPVVDIDLKVRVGINTGKVIVGNLGTKTRIEYTVIGATVNLAQRMESNAPVGGILVTADVREKVKDTFTFTEKKDVTVKGYAETIEAYVVGF
jgi:adenylate cyclase